jgi:hypothetical protein
LTRLSGRVPSGILVATLGSWYPFRLSKHKACDRVL